ncbi:hypothetical protein C8Q77DRAFT_1058614 [Trametes polyzona]|nr:hypothetical protein C8Q77DRAFT_1058614 [Trametes polyzona]
MTSELSTRPSKVQKTAAAVPTRRARKSLKDLPNMPLDIIIEIFCMLTPRDLLSLYRTTKAFRALLTNPQSVAIWRAARYSMPRVFDCPMDVSEPFWANLMYGESKCGVCGAFANVKRIFVEFRSRLCASCMLRFCFTPPKSKKEPWPYDPAAVNLVPYIMHAPGRSTKPRPHYWKPEIEQVTHTLRCLQANVIRGAPGARRALEDYQYARAAHVRVVLEHAARCREVLEKAAVDCSREALVLVRRERYEQCVSSTSTAFWSGVTQSLQGLQSIHSPWIPRSGCQECGARFNHACRSLNREMFVHFHHWFRLERILTLVWRSVANCQEPAHSAA